MKSKKITVRELSKKLKYYDANIVIKQLLQCAIYVRILSTNELSKLEDYYIQKSLKTQKVNYWIEKAIQIEKIIDEINSEKVA